jgi:hypothetical protein
MLILVDLHLCGVGQHALTFQCLMHQGLPTYLPLVSSAGSGQQQQQEMEPVPLHMVQPPGSTGAAQVALTPRCLLVQGLHCNNAFHFVKMWWQLSSLACIDSSKMLQANSLAETRHIVTFELLPFLF